MQLYQDIAIEKLGRLNYEVMAMQNFLARKLEEDTSDSTRLKLHVEAIESKLSDLKTAVYELRKVL